MQKGIFGKAYSPVIYLFVAMGSVILALRYLLRGGSVDFRVLQAGNLLLLITGLLSVQMNIKALRHKSTQGFLRLAYGSFMLKFLLLAIAAIIYIAVNKKDINKPAFFGCFGLYFIYTFIEVRTVMKHRNITNAKEGSTT
jgi:hypothetical protein